MNGKETREGILDGIVTVAQDMRTRVAYLVRALVITFLAKTYQAVVTFLC